MGSSRKNYFTPSLPPVMSSGGSNPYEDMSKTNSSYGFPTNNILFGGKYNAIGSVNNMQQGQSGSNNATSTATDFFKKTNYSPFFTRF